MEQSILQRIHQEMNALPGHLGLYYLNLTTGWTYGVNDGDAFGAASVIKLPLYLHVLAHIDMEETLTVTMEDHVPICGALTLFTQPVSADVRTLCRLMISLSDNTATNRLIRHCGMEPIQASFEKMDLEKTRLRRLLFDREASRAGIQNTICPREIGMLLKRLYMGEGFPQALCREAIDTLMLQQVDHKLNGKLSGRVDIAHKTGEDDRLSHDVGIVYAPKPFILCFAGEDTDVYRWEDLMRRAAYDLYEVARR